MVEKAKNGFLVISLDFELLWGVFDKVNPEEKESYFRNTRKVIPQILETFSDYQISCTWAIVGMLFNREWDEWRENFPDELPAYKNIALSAYEYGKSFRTHKNSDIFCFAPDLVQMIAASPLQELATHTYSHYYCREPGQDLEAFRADLRKSVSIAKKSGYNIKSLVFPRNQFNEKYLEVCFSEGIENVRANPSNWYWNDIASNSLEYKVFRTGDAYIGKNDKSYSIKDVYQKTKSPMIQKASRLLRPRSSNQFLNRLKINRIKSEMTAAARKKEVYHLWWHPHNFGNNTEGNMQDLKILLNHFKKCQEEYNFQSVHMMGLNQIVRDTTRKL